MVGPTAVNPGLDWAQLLLGAAGKPLENNVKVVLGLVTRRVALRGLAHVEAGAKVVCLDVVSVPPPSRPPPGLFLSTTTSLLTPLAALDDLVHYFDKHPDPLESLGLSRHHYSSPRHHPTPRHRHHNPPPIHYHLLPILPSSHPSLLFAALGVPDKEKPSHGGRAHPQVRVRPHLCHIHVSTVFQPFAPFTVSFTHSFSPPSDCLQLVRGYAEPVTLATSLQSSRHSTTLFTLWSNAPKP